jgi:hypothetical protein
LETSVNLGPYVVCVGVLTSSTFRPTESLPILRQKGRFSAMSLQALLHELVVPFYRVLNHTSSPSWSLLVGSQMQECDS